MAGSCNPGDKCIHIFEGNGTFLKKILTITFLCLCQVSGFGLKAGLVLVPGPLLFSGVNVKINNNPTLWFCSSESQEDWQKCSFLGSSLQAFTTLSAPRTVCCSGSAELEELALRLKVVDLDV